MNKNIFINCPFDKNYSELFNALLFAVYFCEFRPRCAKEVADGSLTRLNKIYDIIEDCDFGIHDISETKLNSHKLPRFNMPFELGIFMGAKKFGGKKQKRKNCLIFESVKYRYQEYISDIAGQDIIAHKDAPDEVIRGVRNWLKSLTPKNSIPGADAIIKKYHEYLKVLPKLLKKRMLSLGDVQYADIIQIIEEWIKLNPMKI